MSSIGEPIEVFLTHEERDAVVGALRFWQAITQGDAFDELFGELLDIPSPRPPVGQIDGLCDRLGGST